MPDFYCQGNNLYSGTILHSCQTNLVRLLLSAQLIRSLFWGDRGGVGGGVILGLERGGGDIGGWRGGGGLARFVLYCKNSRNKKRFTNASGLTTLFGINLICWGWGGGGWGLNGWRGVTWYNNGHNGITGNPLGTERLCAHSVYVSV